MCDLLKRQLLVIPPPTLIIIMIWDYLYTAESNLRADNFWVVLYNTFGLVTWYKHPKPPLNDEYLHYWYPMRDPYQTRRHKCPPVFGTGFEPLGCHIANSTPLTARLTCYIINTAKSLGSGGHQLAAFQLGGSITRSCLPMNTHS